MGSQHEYEEGCTICRTFVSGLTDVYNVGDWKTHAIEGTGSSVLWTFEDWLPALFNLGRSAQDGCPWCSCLNSALRTSLGTLLSSPEQCIGSRLGRVEIKFQVAKKRDSYGMCGDMLILRTTFGKKVFIGPHRAPPLRLCVLNTPDFDIFSKTNVENTLNAIEICAQTHTKCPGHKEAPSPLRLVNVLQDKDIRLEKTSEQKIIYVALSYCWGGSRVAEKARTLEENLTARMEGFRLDSLPLTLQDAIKFVRILGIHYIWIDLLCIVQDTAEWPDEAQKMMQYYKNAYLTIVPIMSDSADTGIRPRREEPFHRKVPAPWSRHTGADQILLDAGPRFKMSDAAWNQRGWTWQERLFSSRILFIHDHRMELECWQGSWDSLLGFSEPSWSQPAFLPLSPDTVGQCLCDGSYESWCEVVCSYTTRMLTNPADCLYAFSGIIQMYSQWFSRQTVAGLWKDRLLQELVSWAPRQPMDAHSRDVPSWTWLYTEWWSKGENPIFLQLTEIGLFAPHANLEQIIDEDRPQSTKLQISGVTLDKSSLLHVLEVYRESERSSWLLSRKTPIASFDHKHDSAAGCTCPRKHQMDVCNTYNVMLSLSPPVTALLVGLGTFKFDRENHTRWWHFLMLQPKDQEDQEYRRVGTMHIEADRMDNDYGTIKKELENKSRRSIVLS